MLLVLVKRNVFCLTSVSVFFSLWLTGCERGDVPNLHGYLVVTEGYRLSMIDLLASPPAVTRLDDNPDLLMSDVTKIDDQRFLYQACRKSTGICTINKYDLATRRATIVREGYAPYCAVQHNMLFFYNRYGEEDALLISDCQKNAPAKELFRFIVKADLAVDDQIARVVQISVDEIVYLEQQDRQLIRYNIPEARSISTGIKNCSPKAWRSKTNQLLCKDMVTWEWSLLDLESGSVEKLPELKRFYGVIYLPEYDAIIYADSGYRFPIGERYDVYLYTFESGSNIRIVEHISITSGIWFDRKRD